MRGNPLRIGNLRESHGSIPACAGEPELEGVFRGALGVYPRVCGGTAEAIGAEAIQMGLSPRVRGNHRLRRTPALNIGSIPACAGEPHYQVAPGAMLAVYPRVCGGTGEGHDRQGIG